MTSAARRCSLTRFTVGRETSARGSSNHQVDQVTASAVVVRASQAVMGRWADLDAPRTDPRRRTGRATNALLGVVPWARLLARL